MEKDVTHTKFYKRISSQLSDLHHKYLPFEKSSKISSHYEVVRKRYIDAYILSEIIAFVLSCESSDYLYEIKDDLQLKILKDLKHCSALINLETYLHPFDINSNQDELSRSEEIKKDKSLTLLNVNKTSLSKNIRGLLSFDHKEFLKEKISEWLSIQCSKIISFTFTNEYFARTNKGMSAVVDHVQNLKLASYEDRITLEKQKKYNNSLLKFVYKQLSGYGNALEDLVHNYRMSMHPLSHLTVTLFSLDVYLIKFRCMELEVLTSTYTPSSVRCLQKIKNDITKEHGALSGSLIQVDHKLLAYRDLSPKFHLLLREHASLQKDLNTLNLKERR